MKYFKSKKTMFVVLTLLGIIVLITSSLYLHHRKTNNVNEIISELIGQTIVLSDTAIVKDTIPVSVDSILKQNQYKIISYVDTSYCYSCRLQLKKWKEYISEVSDKKKSVVMLLVFNSSLKHEAENLLGMVDWNMPIFFDKKGYFKKTYNIPDEFALQTFLLDNNNKVIAVGNPVYNPNIKELYNKKMKIDASQQKKTEVKFSKKRIFWGKMRKGEIYEDEIVLHNIGNEKLRVLDISTTCDCIETSLSCLDAYVGDSISLFVKHIAKESDKLSEKIFIRLNTEPQLTMVKVVGN